MSGPRLDVTTEDDSIEEEEQLISMAFYIPVSFEIAVDADVARDAENGQFDALGDEVRRQWGLTSQEDKWAFMLDNEYEIGERLLYIDIERDGEFEPILE